MNIFVNKYSNIFEYPNIRYTLDCNKTLNFKNFNKIQEDFNERAILLFTHGDKSIFYLVLYRVLHAPSVLRLVVGLM